MGEADGIRCLKEIYAERERTGSLRDGVLSRAAEDIEWWAAGPRGILPWAGSWRGRDAVAHWFEVLHGILDYDLWEPLETFGSGDRAVEIVHAGGRVRATGARYESEIVRVWDFSGGRVVRVRSFYDTAAYVAAMKKA